MTTQTQPPTTDYGHGAHGVAHVASFRSLVAVFAALVVLTAITYLASLVHFGEFNLLVALAIAVVKSALVVLFFMHLRYDKPFNSIVFVGCLIFVALFIGLALMDRNAYNNDVSKDQAKGMQHKPGQYKQAAPH